MPPSEKSFSELEPLVLEGTAPQSYLALSELCLNFHEDSRLEALVDKLLSEDKRWLATAVVLHESEITLSELAPRYLTRLEQAGAALEKGVLAEELSDLSGLGILSDPLSAAIAELQAQEPRQLQTSVGAYLAISLLVSTSCSEPYFFDLLKQVMRYGCPLLQFQSAQACILCSEQQEPEAFLIMCDLMLIDECI